ncbi:MAG: DUF3576 domain-containing protein [Caulobacteraceae bacterium]|nr:DUF3576 domain-containing protein [Caulobacter sp.]
MAGLRGAAPLLVAAGVAALGAAGCAHRATPLPGTAGAPASSGLLGLGRRAPARPSANVQAGIGVNAFLWRATLDTLAFMPLASADPFGGVIITDWYVNPEKPDERFKATVYILDTRLRADGLNVNVFHQTKDGAGQWVDAPTSGQTDTDIENAILTRARQIRLSTLNGR